MEHIVGRIEFGNTREGYALKTLHEALMDKAMWMAEAMKKDEEIERLKKLLEEKGNGKQHNSNVWREKKQSNLHESIQGSKRRRTVKKKT